MVKGRDRKMVSVVGMAGSGKSEVASVFEGDGFVRVRFGDITDEEVARRGWELNEENERRVRELLRKEHGMAAYAKLNLPRIDCLLKRTDVVVDGLYSWAEYSLFRKYYGERFVVVAVYASPETRYRRLVERVVRGLTRDEAASRDVAEIEKLDKGGPIAMADFILVNESSIEKLIRQTERLIAELK